VLGIEWLGELQGYTLLRYGARCCAVPRDVSSWDITAKALRNNPRILQAMSLGELESAVDAAGRGHGDGGRRHAELMEGARAGFDLYRFQSRYFAIPAGETFDIDAFRGGSYARAFYGHTLGDLEDEITRRAQKARQKVLFIATVPASVRPAFLRRLVECEVVVLAGPGDTDHAPGFEVIRWSGDGRFDPDSLSPGVLAALRDRGFDLVAIPYEGRDWWLDTTLERLAAAIADRLLIMFVTGQDRMYHGEDVRRIQYNKAYLNSMFRHVPPLEGKRILEVGASDGLACDLLLTEQPARLVGLDVVDIVGCGYPDRSIAYRTFDGRALPFDDCAFDLTFSIATMEHVGEPAGLLAEMIRVTAPGGYCYVQAGPLYFSPFGHHMFGHFDDVPWIHLRRSTDAIVAEAIRRGLDTRFQQDRGETAETYVRSMLDTRHVNGRTFAEYGLDRLSEDGSVEIVALRRSYEGTELLTDDILREVYPVSREDLISHGFEIVCRKVSDIRN
jgi:SAM-dependent methyltransferase